jgi:hypothetical protein
MSLRPRLGLCAVLLIVLAACGEQAETPSAPQASASPSAEAEPSESPEAEATPAPPSEFAGAWVDVTADAIGETAEWTNKVELADLDGDGWVDILFANGGNYDSPGEPVASWVYLNNGDGTFIDATTATLGEHALLTRVIRVADLDADGDNDIVLGTTYDTQTRLLLNHGGGHWADVTETQLPAAELSAGDLKLGDVDGDRDLDMVIADWGDGGPLNDGGIVNLRVNDGTAGFVDVTAERMPNTRIGFSWDLELVDVDNDWDLDLATSCKLCDGSYLFINDGTGTFTDETAGRMPAFGNNYEFAPIDLDADGFLDLVTINDGAPTANGLGEHVFRNDGTGTFEDMTDAWWGPDANIGWDDNAVIALDVESDGDADFLVASLDGPDRLLINDGSGVLSLAADVFDADPSGGTLGVALADLNGDGIVDVVEGQGEVPGHEDERVYFGNPDVLAPDTAAPIIRPAVVGSSVLARVHDNRTPYAPHDWQSIVVRSSAGDVPMTWYGENLFWADLPEGASAIEVCATDAAGNEACAGS